MNALDIVAEWLEKNDFDGLCGDMECACVVGDLNPCGEMKANCIPGYKVDCDCGDHDWHIVTEKPVGR